MRLLLSFAALYLSVVLLQLSSGGVGPLDALSGLKLGFSTEQVGLLGSAHFVGFLIGCWWAPRLTGAIGHSRCFAVFTAMGAIGLLAHVILVDPLAWAGMRVASGMCVAGCYTVIEAWLNAKINNETRGRATGIYRFVDMLGSLAAQMMIGVLEPANYVSYNILAIMCCAALLPLTLTRIIPPATLVAPRLRVGMAFRRSPFAAVSVVVAGLTSAAFRMVGPVYGQEVGLRPDQIGLFLASFVLGGALAQIPTGWIADKVDRRIVLIMFSAAAIGSCIFSVLLNEAGSMLIFVASGLFGLTTFPIFSVAAAHAHDFTENDERVELSAALMFFFAVGAIASPFVASILLDRFGPDALFVFVAFGHVILVAFGFQRMRVRPSARRKTVYVYTPRTTFQVGRLFGQRRTPK